MIYVALLRGINVGGHNKVEMKKLKTTFESLGFTNVSTYINSGNIIFETTSMKQTALVSAIEKVILKDFELSIKVLVRDFKNMETVCNTLPKTWVKNEQMRTDIMFLWESFDSPTIMEQLKVNTVDTIKYVSGAILWNVAHKDYSKSAVPKLMGTALYKNMTIRNVNTVHKIYQLMKNASNQQ